MTKLSIVMPIFNHKEFVAEMIDSIKANDFQDWELLAVDDGSTDDTFDHLASLYENDARIKLIHRDREPKGAPTCRNIGFERAQGKYVIFFDSDDIVKPYCLRQRVEAIENHPELDFMVFPSGVYLNGEFLNTYKYSIFGYPVYKDDIAAFASRTLPFIVWNNIYRTSSLREKGIQWDEKLSSLQDADFNVQTLSAGLRYEYVKARPDYGYRVASGLYSISCDVAMGKDISTKVYAHEKFYKKYQALYHHSYDRQLFSGILWFYNSVSNAGVNYSFAALLQQMLMKYDNKRAITFAVIVKCSRFLEYFLSRKLARQLPLLCYLYRYQWHEKCLAHRIEKLIVN